MDAVITALTFVAVLIVLFGIAGLVKPFWFMKKRRHGGLIAIGAFVLFSVLNTVPIQRPDRIPEAEWAERCCQSNDNLFPLAAVRAGGATPIRRASSTQPGRLSVGPCMSLC